MSHITTRATRHSLKTNECTYPRCDCALEFPLMCEVPPPRTVCLLSGYDDEPETGLTAEFDETGAPF